MDQRTTVCGLEPTNPAKPSLAWKHPILHGIWIGGIPADLIFGAPRLTFKSIAKAEATRLEDIDILEEERLNLVIQSARYQQTLRRYSRRPSPPPSANGRRMKQIVTSMGRTIHHCRGCPARILPTYPNGRNRSGELMEY
jgi:hypothetical protein